MWGSWNLPRRPTISVFRKGPVSGCLVRTKGDLSGAESRQWVGVHVRGRGQVSSRVPPPLPPASEHSCRGPEGFHLRIAFPGGMRSPWSFLSWCPLLRVSRQRMRQRAYCQQAVRALGTVPAVPKHRRVWHSWLTPTSPRFGQPSVKFACNGESCQGSLISGQMAWRDFSLQTGQSRPTAVWPSDVARSATSQWGNDTARTAPSSN